MVQILHEALCVCPTVSSGEQDMNSIFWLFWHSLVCCCLSSNAEEQRNRKQSYNLNMQIANDITNCPDILRPKKSAA